MRPRPTITVRSTTGGATWEVSRGGTRLGFRANEGLEHPKRSLAEAEANEIAERCGGRVEVMPL